MMNDTDTTVPVDHTFDSVLMLRLATINAEFARQKRCISDQIIWQMGALNTEMAKLSAEKHALYEVIRGFERECMQRVSAIVEEAAFRKEEQRMLIAECEVVLEMELGENYKMIKKGREECVAKVEAIKAKAALEKQEKQRTISKHRTAFEKMFMGAPSKEGVILIYDELIGFIEAETMFDLDPLLWSHR